MVSTKAASTPRPREAEVRSELVALRRAKGLDVASVRANAKKLQRLPIVDDEIERSEFAPADRVIAAVKVVRCAVEDMAKNDQQSFEILVRTLTNRDRTQSLEAIRKSLMMRFHFSENSRPHFDQIEASAYTRLATSLVEADVSPCRLIAVEVVASELAQIYYQRQIEIEETLAGYGYSFNDPILQQALRRALMQKLPHGARVLVTHSVPVELWPDALLIVAYELHRSELVHGRHLLSPNYFYDEFIRPRAEQELREQLERIASIHIWKVHPTDLALDRAQEDLRLRRTHLVREIARCLRREEEQNWPSLVGSP